MTISIWNTWKGRFYRVHRHQVEHVNRRGRSIEVHLKTQLLSSYQGHKRVISICPLIIMRCLCYESSWATSTSSWLLKNIISSARVLPGIKLAKKVRNHFWSSFLIVSKYKLASFASLAFATCPFCMKIRSGCILYEERQIWWFKANFEHLNLFLRRFIKCYLSHSKSIA